MPEVEFGFGWALESGTFWLNLALFRLYTYGTEYQYNRVFQRNIHENKNVHSLFCICISISCGEPTLFTVVLIQVWYT